CRLETQRLRCRISAVQRAQRTYNHFTRNYGAEQPNSDLPVKAQRLNHRLNPLADVPNDALRQISMEGDMTQDPEHDHDAQNYRACLLYKYLAAVEQPQPQRPRRRDSILWQLQNERRR